MVLIDRRPNNIRAFSASITAQSQRAVPSSIQTTRNENPLSCNRGKPSLRTNAECRVRKSKEIEIECTRDELCVTLQLHAEL